MSRPRFFNLGTIDIGGWILLCCGDCPTPCRKFISLPGLHPLDAGSTFRSHDNEKCLHVLPKVPGETKSSQLGSTNLGLPNPGHREHVQKHRSLEGKGTLRTLRENYPDLEMLGLPRRVDVT